MDDKTGADMLKTFMKQPVSTLNMVLILFVAFGWYYSRENNMEKLGAAARAQEARIDRVEKKIEAGDVNDAVQNGKLIESLNLLGNRITAIESDTRWLVRQQGGPMKP